MVFAFKDEGGVHEWCTVGEDGENVSEISSVEFLNERNSSIRENIAVEKLIWIVVETRMILYFEF